MSSRRLWVGVAVTGVFLVLLFIQIDLRETTRSLGDANFLYLVPGILLYFLAVAFRTLRWKYLLAHLKSIQIRSLFLVVVVGYMANNLLPVRLGEVVRSYYLAKRESISVSATLATIVLERLFDGLTLLLLLALVTLVLPVDRLVQNLAEDLSIPSYILVLAMSMPFAVVFMLLITAAYRPGWPILAITQISKRLPRRTASSLVNLATLFISGLTSLRDPRRVQMLLLLSLPVWLLEASMLYVIGFSFHLQTHFSNQIEMAAAVLAVTATSNLATSLPSSQGGIGPFEFFAIGTLVVFGVPASEAAAYAFTVHVALLLPVIVAGLGILWYQNVSFRTLRSIGNDPRPGKDKSSGG